MVPPLNRISGSDENEAKNDDPSMAVSEKSPGFVKNVRRFENKRIVRHKEIRIRSKTSPTEASRIKSGQVFLFQTASAAARVSMFTAAAGNQTQVIDLK